MHQEKKLFIRNVDSESAGRYTCTIINKAGSDYRNFLVSVYHPPSFDNTQGPFSRALCHWFDSDFIPKIAKFSNFGKIFIDKWFDIKIIIPNLKFSIAHALCGRR